MPNNNNGYAENHRLLFGLCDLYIDDVFVGNLKEAVTVNITREYAEQKAGDNIAPQKAEVMSEEWSIEATVADFKLAQLRRALGINQAVAVESAEIRKREVLKLTGTSLTSPAETMISGGVVKVMKLDRSSTYVQGTDYTLSGTPLDIARITNIGDGDFVILEYDFNDAGASRLKFGGEIQSVPTFQLDCVHRKSNGKLVQIRLYKAYANTDFSLAFNEKTSGDYNVHNITFKALVDVTKPNGQNMGEFVEEDA